jgi:hypothetical protein
MEKVFNENDIDIIVAPADSALAHPAATAGKICWPDKVNAG